MVTSIALTDDLASAGVHLCGMVLVLLFGAYLLRRAQTPLARLAIKALCAAWIALYLASIGYHLTRFESGWHALTLALDDAAIFVAIAGTYTPFALLALPRADGRLVMRLLWCCTAAGVTLGLAAAAAGYVHWYQPSVLVISAVYGWGPAIAYCRSLARALPEAGSAMVIASGLVYVGGTWFYRAHDLPWHHTYWHVAVMLGCLLDFAAVASLLISARRAAVTRSLK